MDPLYLDVISIFVSEFFLKKGAKQVFSVFLVRVRIGHFFDVFEFDVFPPGISLQIKIFIFKFCNFNLQDISFLLQLGHL